MIEYYEPKYFKAYELVPPEVYKVLGKKSFLCLDYYILKTIDEVKICFGMKPVIINDWHWGGNKKYRGFRPGNCKVGAKYSQHKFGRAVDLTVKGVSSFDVRTEIINHPFHFTHITAVEVGISWVHFDVRPTKEPYRIETFKP